MAEWREIRAVLDVSPQRGREGSARGFNPGNTVPRRRALKLKGRQIKRVRISRPFRANHLFGWFPGLKPWAEPYGPLRGKNHPKFYLTSRHSTHG
jgi:hypothetical protein